MFNFISLLLNEYFDEISKESLFLRLCIKNKIEETIIKHLIESEFKITDEDINFCIKENILKDYLSRKFNNT